MLWTSELSQRIKRITKWKASYFTHPASYEPVPQTSMPLSAAIFMTSLPAESLPKEAEITMKEWTDHYKPVRQRSARSETTKEKQALFHQLCSREQKLEHGASFLFQIAGRKVQPLHFLMIQYSCLRHLTVRLSLLSVTRKFPKPLIAIEPEPIQMDEFESDSDSDYDETESEETRTAITRSG